MTIYLLEGTMNSIYKNFAGGVLKHSASDAFCESGVR